jgi:hypothetical protein
MKSIIKSLSRNEKRTIIFFKRDNQIIKNIERAFNKLKRGFELSNNKKRYGDKIIEDFWELNKKDEDFNFTLIAKRDFVKLRLKGSLSFVREFLKILEPYTEFYKQPNMTDTKTKGE